MQGYEFLIEFKTDFEASIVAAKLAEYGIPTFLAGMRGSARQQYARGNRIYVNPEDLGRAKELIDSGQDALTEDSDISSS